MSLGPLALALALLAAPVAAQESKQHHGAMDDPMQAAMRQMQQGMDIPSSGNPDVDFATMMIPHHQGAIDMAKAELANGKDVELRELAQEIIAAQEREIAFLKAWLKKNAP